MRDGTWERLNHTLRSRLRQKGGRHQHPTAGCLESQSVKCTAVPGPRGYDAGKKVNGRKRHIPVDTLGLLLAILDLFRFIDWVLELPAGLEDQLWTEIEQLDEEKRMHYLASFERKAQAKGIEKGRAEGQVKFFSFLLQQRFGELPGWVEARVQQATPEQLEAWGGAPADGGVSGGCVCCQG